jgi:hypothetical protein
VPGALGDRPHPNQVARAEAKGLVAFFTFFHVLSGCGNEIFFTGPIAEVD